MCIAREAFHTLSHYPTVGSAGFHGGDACRAQARWHSIIPQLASVGACGESCTDSPCRLVIVVATQVCSHLAPASQSCVAAELHHRVDHASFVRFRGSSSTGHHRARRDLGTCCLHALSRKLTTRCAEWTHTGRAQHPGRGVIVSCYLLPGVRSGNSSRGGC